MDRGLRIGVGVGVGVAVGPASWVGDAQQEPASTSAQRAYDDDSNSHVYKKL